MEAVRYVLYGLASRTTGAVQADSKGGRRLAAEH